MKLCEVSILKFVESPASDEVGDFFYIYDINIFSPFFLLAKIWNVKNKDVPLQRSKLKYQDDGRVRPSVASGIFYALNFAYMAEYANPVVCL